MKRQKFLEILKDEIRNQLFESIDEGQYKVDGHVFNKVHTSEGTAFIGDDGVLGSNNKLIPWDSIMQYYKKVNKESYMHAGDSNLRTEDVVEKGISKFFKKLRNKKNKKQMDAFLEKDPELKNALDVVAKKQTEIDDLLLKFAKLK